MHKVLLAMLMALFLTLALVGVKRIAQGNTASAGHKTMVAEGTMPAPPIPW